MKRLLVLLFVLAAHPLYAQSVTSWNFRVYNQGASAPIQAPTVLQAANVTCNQPAVTNPGQVSNPSQITFADPVNAGKSCIWKDPGTGVLFSLPFGAQVYESTLSATNSVATSAESARSNLFTRPGNPPAVPTGVLVVP